MSTQEESCVICENNVVYDLIKSKINIMAQKFYGQILVEKQMICKVKNMLTQLASTFHYRPFSHSTKMSGLSNVFIHFGGNFFNVHSDHVSAAKSKSHWT